MVAGAEAGTLVEVATVATMARAKRAWVRAEARAARARVVVAARARVVVAERNLALSRIPCIRHAHMTIDCTS